MRKNIFSIFAAAVMLFISAVSSEAHPPKTISLSWDGSSHLSVAVSHGVNDTAKHYVYQITIYGNNAMLMQRSYSSQSSAETHSDTFDLGALASGTKLRVEAACVIMGTASAEVVIQ